MAFRGLDIIGETFGRLMAIRPLKERYGSNVVWLCRCSCGRTHRA
jgi:hypothetical protein